MQSKGTPQNYTVNHNWIDLKYAFVCQIQYLSSCSIGKLKFFEIFMVAIKSLTVETQAVSSNGFFLSDAPASLALMIVCKSLTDRNWRLAISHVLQFSHHSSCILSGGNICLVSLV